MHMADTLLEVEYRDVQMNVRQAIYTMWNQAPFFFIDFNTFDI